MTPRRQLSEEERVGCFIMLFPPLWPLGLAWLLCMAVEALSNKTRVAWHRLKLKFKRTDD